VPEKMKTPVSDTAVDDFVARIRAGVPTGKVLPARMSECDFTPAQREKIKKANAERKASLKKGTTSLAPKTLTKLRKMLYLQHEKCFFCGQPLREQDASIEHLNPQSRDGSRTEDNEVVCHKTLNQAFGNMDLKRKFEFVLKEKVVFKCPGT
jgi:CRISPR/Cas system Type II protein with McrA/HNH and RuvC-like nuclease domain